MESRFILTILTVEHITRALTCQLVLYFLYDKAYENIAESKQIY